jgi:hypothetical protein
VTTERWTYSYRSLKGACWPHFVTLGRLVVASNRGSPCSVITRQVRLQSDYKSGISGDGNELVILPASSW